VDSPAEEREGILQTCSDPEVVCEVRALLMVHDRDHEFMERPATPRLSVGRYEDKRAAVPKRIGPYRVLAELGRGGMGTVYLAVRTTDFEQEVAIKLIKRGLDTDEILKRFRQERQILAGLNHPYIARFIDGGSTYDGRPYFVMERVRGERIDVYCAGHKVGLTGRIKLFQEVCRAVQFAHEHLVIHRDIKPSNILVAEDGTPKLLDFGVAKLLQPGQDPETTLTASWAFTPDYASPEQIRGDLVCTPSDIYSLGLLLCELLMGNRRQRAKEAKLPEQQKQTIIHSQSPTLAVELEKVVEKAISEDPRDRYGSAEKIAEDLERYLQGRPVLASLGLLGYRAVPASNM